MNKRIRHRGPVVAGPRMLPRTAPAALVALIASTAILALGGVTIGESSAAALSVAINAARNDGAANDNTTNDAVARVQQQQPVQVDARLLAAQRQRVEMIERARAATVAVFAAGGRGGGSAVLISPDGYALSNFHVTSGAGDYMQCGLSDGKLYDAVIVGIDPTGDVALLKLLGREDFPFAPLGDSGALHPGDGCFAMGNPFLLATDFAPTVTFGIVSGVHRYQYPAGTLLEYADCIQTDASINPGNSGGPLFNMVGEVVGINGRGSFEKRGRVNVGVGYAISINQIKHFMGYLHSGRIVDHATLGARVAMAEDGRVRVIDVLDSSDAYRRGLRYDDELIAFGGRAIQTSNGFKNALGIFPKGWRVPVTFRRDGETFDVYVRLAGVHQQSDLISKAQGREQPQQPQPDDDGGDDNEEDDNEGDQPQPQPLVPGSQSGMPEHVAALFEARHGYANYHFNDMEQKRVWSSLTSGGLPGAGKGVVWTLSAKVPGDLPATLTISDSQVKLELPGGEQSMEIDVERPSISGNTLPIGSGGLIPAAYCWRRFLTRGVEGFGVMYYLGKVPFAGYRENPTLEFTKDLVDCLVGEHAGAECRFFVDSESGTLLAMEYFPEKNAEPCEIVFTQHAEIDGVNQPVEWQVRYGAQTYQTFTMTEFKSAAAPDGAGN